MRGQDRKVEAGTVVGYLGDRAQPFLTLPLFFDNLDIGIFLTFFGQLSSDGSGVPPTVASKKC